MCYLLQVWPPPSSPEATRTYSHACLNSLASVLPNLLGGSADLAGSTKAYLDRCKDFSASCHEGRNLRYGVREHAMAAIR